MARRLYRRLIAAAARHSHHASQVPSHLPRPEAAEPEAADIAAKMPLRMMISCRRLGWRHARAGALEGPTGLRVRTSPCPGADNERHTQMASVTSECHSKPRADGRTTHLIALPRTIPYHGLEVRCSTNYSVRSLEKGNFNIPSGVQVTSKADHILH